MHSHGHDHGHASTSAVLRFSLIATALYIAILVIAGIRADSLALLSEAGHNVSDFLALLVSWAAVKIAARPSNERKTYGYHRAGVLAAFINSLGLVLICFWIFYEAVHRLLNPEPVQAGIIIWASLAGVVLNGVITWALMRTARDVNIRSVILHEIGDTLSTAAVMVGGIVIYFTGQNWIDPALSFGIAALILWSSLGIIRETLNILLEGTPRGLDVAKVAITIKGVPGVLDVHDLHVWSLGSEMHALSCHIAIDDIPPSVSSRILGEVNKRLHDEFGIHHTTIQFECEGCEFTHGCVIPVQSHQH